MKKKTKHKIWKCTQGAISILLACLMTPFLSLASVLIEAGRYQSGVRALDEALGTSSISTLANFDKYILERFGLLSVSQSSANVNEDLTDSVNNYLSKQQTTDMKTVDVDEVSVTGVYPLADTKTLKQQLTHSMSVLAPTKFILEGADIDNLIAQLEESLSFLNVIKQISAGVDLLNKEVKMLEAMDDAKDLMKETQTVVETYETEFSEFQTAVQDLIDHLKTDRPDSEAHPIMAAAWDTKKNTLVGDANDAKTAYSKAIQGLINAFDTLHSQINSALGAKQDFAASIVTFSATSSNAIIDEYIAEHKNDKEFEAFCKTIKGANNSLDQTGKATAGRLKEALENFSPDSVLVAMESLIELKKTVDSYSISSITGNSSKPSNSKYFIDDLEELTDPDKLEAFVKESENELNDSGLIDFIQLIVDIFNSFCNTEFMIDAELNTLIDVEYYNDAIGGIPSKQNRSADFANPFEKQDEKHAAEILEMIDPNYNKDDPFGLIADTPAGKFEELVRSIQDAMKKFKDIGDAEGFIEKLKAFGNALLSVLNIVGKLISWVASLIQSLVTAAYHKFLICSYMTYNMPNRTNYKTGTGLTGYSYGKISRMDSTLVSTIPVIGDLGVLISDPEINFNFTGAELEYIMWGNLYEQSNVFMNFWALTLIRVLLNLPAICADPTMQGLASTIIGIVAVVAVLLVESLTDVYVLVNGDDISLVKTKLFYSPQGIPDLITKLGSITLSQATKNGIAKKAAKAFGVSYTEPPQTKPSTDKKPLIDVNKYKNELLSLDYGQYSFMLMLLLPEEAMLKRMTDLIQFEMTMKLQTDGASLSQTITGEYDTFNINQAYTALRVSAAGSLNNIFPFPSISEGNVLEFDRVIYRGY